MSRIGKNPVKIEEGVEVAVNGKEISFKGKMGELKVELPWHLDAKMEGDTLVLENSAKDKKARSLHGTFRSLIANAIIGVKEGYKKNLELVGVGYRASLQGTKLVMSLGLNHTIEFETPAGYTIEVPDETKIIISGIDKQGVGELAAKIREVRKPEPYKGKGIRYAGEYVRKKSSKSSVATK